MKLILFVNNQPLPLPDATTQYIETANWTPPTGIRLEGQTLEGESPEAVWAAYRSLAQEVALVREVGEQRKDPVLVAIPLQIATAGQLGKIAHCWQESPLHATFREFAAAIGYVADPTQN